MPDSARLWEIVQAWGEAASAISDVEGLRANFVINLLPESALAVAKNNGVGNVWGLQDSGSLIGTSPFLARFLSEILRNDY